MTWEHKDRFTRLLRAGHSFSPLRVGSGFRGSRNAAVAIPGISLTLPRMEKPPPEESDRDHATASSPFFSISDNNLREAPDGRFSPRSHLLTRLLVTFR